MKFRTLIKKKKKKNGRFDYVKGTSDYYKIKYIINSKFFI